MPDLPENMGVLLTYSRTSYNATNAVLHSNTVHAKYCPTWKLHRCSNNSVLNECCKETRKQTVKEINSNKLIDRQTPENISQ